MASYYVASREELRIESASLAEELARRWPGLTIDERDDASNTLRWEVPMPSGYILSGDINPTGRGIDLDGDVFDAAEFAQWMRTQIPESYPLSFFDESYTEEVPLTSATTTEELTQPFLA
jgi:hypothetical protein